MIHEYQVHWSPANSWRKTAEEEEEEEEEEEDKEAFYRYSGVPGYRTIGTYGL